jgi:hypothetical protein
MRACPFCGATLDDESTFCALCGHSLVSALPSPLPARRHFYLALSILSILLGIGSCAFTFVPRLYMSSLALIIASIGLGGFILERTRGNFENRLVKVLAVVGMLFGVLGYISFMFLRSNVPGCGYTL